MTDALQEYRNIVTSWKETPFDELNQSAELMKDMAIVLSDLTMHKIEFKKQWNAHIFKRPPGESIASAERAADNAVPELAELREIIRAGNNILDAIRSQVSLLKSEKN